MSSCLLIFPGIRSSLVFLSLDLSLLPLVFSLILTVASRLLHPYNIDDKSFRLMVKDSPQRRTPREVHRVMWRREEGGGRQS